jgi:hypothetical protein
VIFCQVQLTIFVGFLLLRCGVVCIKGTLDTCYPGLAYPSNNNTSTEANIDHSDFLVLHIAEMHLCSNLCLDNWKLLGFRHYIFLSKLVDSFFCMPHSFWTVRSSKLCTHHTILQLFWKEFTMRKCSWKPASSNPCWKLILETLSERE